MQKYDKLEAMKSLGTLWKLGETSWKLTARAVVGFHFAQEAMQSPNSVPVTLPLSQISAISE